METKKIAANGTAKVAFTLKNSGNHDGDEVAQVYFRHVQSSVPQPNLTLCGFCRVNLKRGQSRKVAVDVPAERLRYWMSSGSNTWLSRGIMSFLSARRPTTSG